MQRCETHTTPVAAALELSAVLSRMMQATEFHRWGCVPTARSGPRMTQRVRCHRGQLLVERRPGVEPLERANRRRGGMTDDAIFQTKKKVRLAHTHSRDLSAIPCTSCRTAFAQNGRRLIAFCRFPKNRIEGGVVITSPRNSREFCNDEGDVLGAFTVERASVSGGERI